MPANNLNFIPGNIWRVLGKDINGRHLKTVSIEQNSVESLSISQLQGMRSFFRKLELVHIDMSQLGINDLCDKKNIEICGIVKDSKCSSLALNDYDFRNIEKDVSLEYLNKILLSPYITKLSLKDNRIGYFLHDIINDILANGLCGSDLKKEVVANEAEKNKDNEIKKMKLLLVAFENLFKNSRISTLDLSNNDFSALQRENTKIFTIAWETFGRLFKKSQIKTLILINNGIADTSDNQWKEFCNTIKDTSITKVVFSKTETQKIKAENNRLNELNSIIKSNKIYYSGKFDFFNNLKKERTCTEIQKKIGKDNIYSL